MRRHWRIWTDEDTGPVQWPTREPVRPPLREDGEGWRLAQIGRYDRRPTRDWFADALFIAVVCVLGGLLALSVLVGG